MNFLSVILLISLIATLSKAQQYFPVYDDAETEIHPVYSTNSQKNSYSSYEKNPLDELEIGFSSDQATEGRLEPRFEVLQLIESFLKFKAEIRSKFYALIADNSELIKALTKTLVSRLGSLHQFTLMGVQIFRKILQFASTLMGGWKSNDPGFDFGL